MSSKQNNEFNPNYAVPPGETLLENIEYLGMSQADLAQRMGRPLKTINEIIKGKAAITPETALQLEKVLGVPASFWNNAERNYREILARLEQESRFQEQVAWLKSFPLHEMIQWQWIKEWKEPVKQLEEVLQYFGVASPDAWKEVWHNAFTGRLGVEFRKSKSFESSWTALAAWLRKGELESQQTQCAEFSADKFKESLQKLRTMTAAKPEVFEPAMTQLCAQSGVAVTFVPCLPKTHVSGATRWLSPTRAILQLSLRGKTDDLFWFTFFHEAGHILLHGKKDVFIEDHTGGDAKEGQADKFAADFLIPPSDWKRFLTNLRHAQKTAVLAFARELGIAPSIVVGRLQHEKLLHPGYLNDLKVRFEWAKPAASAK